MRNIKSIVVAKWFVTTISFLGEIQYIINNTNKIIRNAKVVYSQKIKNIDIGYIENCVDYKLLEEKCKDWKK